MGLYFYTNDWTEPEQNSNGHKNEVRDISNTELRQLLDGFSIEPPRGFGNIKARDFT